MADDVKAKAIISVYAETAPAVKEIDKLTDAQKKMGDGFEKSGNSISSFVGKAAEGFAKFNLAIGGVEKAFQLLSGAMDTAFEVHKREAMEKMLPTGAVEKLSAATDHLISRQDTLRLSVRGMTGDYKVTEDQMQKVLQASVAFSQKGLGPAADIADKLLDGIAGKTGKLDDLGIAFEKTGSAAGDAAELFAKMDAAIQDPNNAVDEKTKSMAAMRDNIETVTLAIHDMEAGIVDIVATAIDGWKDILGYSARAAAEKELRDARDRGTRIIAAPTPSGWNDSPYADALAGSMAMYRGGSGGLSDSDYASALYGDIGGTVGTGKTGHAIAAKRGIPVVIVGVESGGGQLGGVFGAGRDIDGSLGGGGAFDRFGNPVAGVGSATGLSFSGTGLHGLGALVGNDNGSFRGGAGGTALAGVGNGGGNDTKHELQDAGFSALAGGINAAVQAAVDGSDAIGRSAAKASAAVLKSLAIEATGRAVFEGALALGSLAIQDYKGAALHGAAAAKFAIAAGLEGSLAAGLGAIAGGSGGGSGSGASGPAGGGFGSATGGTSGGGGTMNITINVGAGFDGDAVKLGDTVARQIRAAQLKGTRGNYATSVSG